MIKRTSLIIIISVLMIGIVLIAINFGTYLGAYYVYPKYLSKSHDPIVGRYDSVIEYSHQQIPVSFYFYNDYTCSFKIPLNNAYLSLPSNTSYMYPDNLGIVYNWRYTNDHYEIYSTVDNRVAYAELDNDNLTLPDPGLSNYSKLGLIDLVFPTQYTRNKYYDQTYRNTA